MSTGGGGKSKSKKGGFMAVLKAAQKEKRETEAAAAEEKEEAAEAKSGLEKPEVLHLMQRDEVQCWADSEVEMHRLVSRSRSSRRARLPLVRRAAQCSLQVDPLLARTRAQPT